MTLSLHERYPLAHPADAVWPRLADIAFVAECFPGASLEGEQADGGHNGSLTMRLGPTRARFAGTVHVDLDDSNRIATLRAIGSDSRRSAASADATVRLEPVDESKCTIAVDVDIEISGPLGQFARAGGAEVTRTLLVDFAANVDRRLADAASAAMTTTATDGRDASASGGVAESAPATRPAPPNELSIGSVVLRSARAALSRAVARIRAVLSRRKVGA